MPDELTQEVTVGGLPGRAGATLTPPTPGTQVEIAADPRRQYVAGTALTWYANYPRALPWALDDVTADFGADIYRRMLLDAQVRSVVNVIKAGILETGVVIHSAIADKMEDGYDQAVALAGRAESMLAELSIDEILWDMLDGVALGHKMAEMVFDLETAPSGAREYTLSRLATKPHESVAFVVDAYLSVLGVLGRIPGQPFGVQQGMLLADLQATANLLPRSKFAVFTFRPVNGDPRGTSILRPAFAAWNGKLHAAREHLKYLSQFATPLMVGFTGPGAQAYPVPGPDGQPTVDIFGNVVMRAPEQDMLATLQSAANGTAMAFSHGAVVQAIQNAGDGEAFLKALDAFNKEIAKAVLNQTLATEEGQHQARAASQTHKDVMDMLIRQAKRPLERMLERDIIRTWLMLNGMDDPRLRPQVALGDVAAEDIAKLWTAAASLQTAGYLDPSQYPALDETLQLPERASSDTTEETEDDPDAGDDETAPLDGTGTTTGTKPPATMSQATMSQTPEEAIAAAQAELDDEYRRYFESRQHLP